MKRLLLMTLALGLLLSASFAFSQTELLYLENPPSSDSYDGIYVSPYAFSTQSGNQGSTTQMFCDDFADEQGYGGTTFVISQVGVGNWYDNSLWNNNHNYGYDEATLLTLYDEAAYLALGLKNQTGNEIGYYSYAIWAVLTRRPYGTISWRGKLERLRD